MGGVCGRCVRAVWARMQARRCVRAVWARICVWAVWAVWARRCACVCVRMYVCMYVGIFLIVNNK